MTYFVCESGLFANNEQMPQKLNENAIEINLIYLKLIINISDDVTNGFNGKYKVSWLGMKLAVDLTSQ